MLARLCRSDTPTLHRCDREEEAPPSLYSLARVGDPKAAVVQTTDKIKTTDSAFAAAASINLRNHQVEGSATPFFSSKKNCQGLIVKFRRCDNKPITNNNKGEETRAGQEYGDAAAPNLQTPGVARYSFSGKSNKPPRIVKPPAKKKADPIL